MLGLAPNMLVAFTSVLGAPPKLVEGAGLAGSDAALDYPPNKVLVVGLGTSG